MAAGEFTKAFMGGLGGAVPGALLGAVALPFQLAAAGRQLDFQRSATEAQLAAANYTTQQDTANRIMGLFSQAGENTAARNAAIGFAADLDLARQIGASRIQLGEFAPKEMGLAYEKAKREQDLATSPAAKENLYQNLLNYKRQKGFDIAAQGEATFGPTAFSRRFTA